MIIRCRFTHLSKFFAKRKKMYSTKKLWKPFREVVVSRALPSTSRFASSIYNYNFSSQIHLLNFSSSSRIQNPVLHRGACYYFEDFRFSGRSFCSKSAAKAHNATCWNCNETPKKLPFLFCESCRSVQPVDHSVDYFKIFGLEKKYEIGNENLEGKYKDWQKKLHPDLVHSKSEKEREFAAEQSGRVIEAYRTLTNPLSRAIYILRLEGVEVDEEETVSEPDLLMEIMEIREAVEDAADSQTLDEIQSQMQEKLMHWGNSFGDAFRNRKFEEARVCIRRMTYYHRVKEEIAKKL